MPDQLVITNTVTVPPGGWRYTQVETGHTLSSISLGGLKEQVEVHRRANGLDLSDGWWELVQAEMCVEMDVLDTHCLPATERLPEPDDRVTVRHVLQFFRVVREWWFKKGRQQVVHEEAEKRAQTCLSGAPGGEPCPYNTTDVKGCWGCEGVLRWLKDLLTDADKVEGEEGLHTCKVCKCALKLKIHLPREVIEKGTTGDQSFPDYCWMNEDTPA